MFFPKLRKRSVAALLVAVLLSVAAFAAPVLAAKEAGSGGVAAGTRYPLTVTDYEGREVVIPARPQRIISMAPSNTEILFALGLGDRVVGVDTFSDYPGAANEKTRIGDLWNPNIEQMIALKPDLVLAISGSEKMWGKLAEMGVPVLVIQPTNVAESIESVRFIGQVTGATRAGNAVAAMMQAKVDHVAERIQRISRKPRVFWEIWHDPLMSAGPGSFMDDLITRVGGINLAGNAGSPWPEVSAEAIIAADPEVIITSDAEWARRIQNGEIPGWTRTTAVRYGRVLVIDPNLTSRPGPRLVQGLDLTARLMWPWLFQWSR